MSRWWRAYEDSVDHPKLLKLSDKMHRAWFTLQCIASANDGVLPPAADIAVRLREKHPKVAEWITHLVKAGLIDNVDGVFKPHNWDSRQFKSDTSTPRVKAFRDRKKVMAGKSDTVVGINVSGNVSGNVSETSNETPPEAEAEAESETEQSRADAGPPVDEDLGRKASALAAAVSALFLSRSLPLPKLDRCLFWLTQGYSHDNVISGVEMVLKRGKRPAALEYFDGAIRDQFDANPPLRAGSAAPIQNVFVEVGTLEWGCWEQEHRRLGKRPPPQRDTRIDGVIKTGWWFVTRVPEGYDECTGERISTTEAEDAA